MKYFKITPLLLAALLPAFSAQGHEGSHINLKPVVEFSLGKKVGLLRSVVVQISPKESALLMVYSADKAIDPYIEMFYPPSDTLKLELYTLKGKPIWKKELSKTTINGHWFLPVFPFDLDQDGSDEIYYVANTDEEHILSYKGLRLQAIDSKTGDSIGEWEWPRSVYNENLSHTFRNFIMGGYVNGEPVLVTAQGTYEAMGLQGWSKGMESRWNVKIKKEDPGPRGSHMSPVVDYNNDGIDEVMWGERCISVDDGHYLFIADEQEYKGHSDVIQPTLDRASGKWSLFTCRESGSNGEIKPRVVMFDQEGERIWTDLEEGHMDAGWTAHVYPENPAILGYTIRIGSKKADRKGFFRGGVEEFTYDALTGKRVIVPFKLFETIPVDLDGDGYHEFVRAHGEQGDRKVFSITGEELAFLGEGAYLAMGSKFLDLPGEQILCYHSDGTIRIWADTQAEDSSIALKRYASPYYKLCQRQTANGVNLVNLGGL